MARFRPKATYRAPYGYVLISSDNMPLAVNNRRGHLTEKRIQIASRPGYDGGWVRNSNVRNGVGSKIRRIRDGLFA